MYVNVQTWLYVVKGKMQSRKNNLRSEVAAEITRGMDERGWTAEQLAKVCGVDRETVRSWRIGRRAPKDDLLEAIREAFAEVRPREKIRLAIPPDMRSGGRGVTTPAREGTRISTSQREALHIAIDVILDDAPGTVKDKIAERLTELAGRHGKRPR
jgi:transcriptional regulator with XRE-family HTH domain